MKPFQCFEKAKLTYLEYYSSTTTTTAPAIHPSYLETSRSFYFSFDVWISTNPVKSRPKGLILRI